jgi:hypothetical protein
LSSSDVLQATAEREATLTRLGDVDDRISQAFQLLYENPQLNKKVGIANPFLPFLWRSRNFKSKPGAISPFSVQYLVRIIDEHVRFLQTRS